MSESHARLISMTAHRRRCKLPQEAQRAFVLPVPLPRPHLVRRVCHGVRMAVDPVSPPASHASLRGYLESAGVDMGALRITEPRPGVRGVVASNDIAAGEPLVQVPRCAALAASATDGPWWLMLAGRLLVEEARGSSSPWVSYIRGLPEDPPDVASACLHHGVGEIARKLQPYGLGASARRYWSFLQSTFEEGKSNGLIKPETKWSRFVWAVGTVQSRAFRVDKGPESAHSQFALLPGIDLLNHSVVLKTAFDLDTERDAFVIRSGYGFEAGEEVFVSYGSKTNEDLLFFYGFVEGNNPADAVNVPSKGILRRALGANRGLVSHVAEKNKLLCDSGLVSDSKGYSVRRDGMDDEIMSILRVVFATPEEMENLSVAYVQSSRGQVPTLSLRSELLAWKCIARECDRMLLRLPKIARNIQNATCDLRRSTICSCEWDWESVGDGATLGEGVFVAERREVLEATKARVNHFADISKKVGRVATVLLPPTQSLLSTTVFEGLSAGDSTSGVSSFSF